MTFFTGTANLAKKVPRCSLMVLHVRMPRKFARTNAVLHPLDSSEVVAKITNLVTFDE